MTLLYVYDASIHQAWGPFFTRDEAEYFVSIDEGLVKWALIIPKSQLDTVKTLQAQMPEAFNPDWSKNYGLT